MQPQQNKAQHNMSRSEKNGHNFEDNYSFQITTYVA